MTNEEREKIALDMAQQMLTVAPSSFWSADDLKDMARAAIAAILPHIEAAALSDLVEFSKQKSWSLNYKRPFYCDDDDQEQGWIVYEEIGPINDRDWNVIGKGETAAEAIAAALKNEREKCPFTSMMQKTNMGA